MEGSPVLRINTSKSHPKHRQSVIPNSEPLQASEGVVEGKTPHFVLTTESANTIFFLHGPINGR